MRACRRDGLLAVERFQRVQKSVHCAAALVVRGELPTAVAGRTHHRKQFRRLDEELAAVVRIGFAVELFSERPIWISLIGRADGHAAVEGQLERSELQPGVAGVSGVGRGFDLLL